MTTLVAAAPAVLFYIFSTIAVVCALLVVGLRNPMYGAMAMLGTFLSIAVLFLVRGAEFLAVVQVFVYAGGIMVLFLFVIMLVNLHRVKEANRFLPGAWVALGVTTVLVGVLAWALLRVGWGPAAGVVGAPGNSESVALGLYRDTLLPFEIASVFLLVAMIGAVVLGKRS